MDKARREETAALVGRVEAVVAAEVPVPVPVLEVPVPVVPVPVPTEEEGVTTPVVVVTGSELAVLKKRGRVRFLSHNFKST